MRIFWLRRRRGRRCRLGEWVCRGCVDWTDGGLLQERRCVRWVGWRDGSRTDFRAELYLELHRGTATSHGSIKK